MKQNQVNESQNPTTETDGSPRPAPEIKWYWHDTEHPLCFRMPEEVKTWHPSVAYPVNQVEGVFTQILWPYGALYKTHKEALEVAIAAQERHVQNAQNKLDRLRSALAKLNEPARDAETAT